MANLVIVLLWQICYFHWCLNYISTSSINSFYMGVWAIYIAMDLVSLLTLCYALYSIRSTLRIK